MDSTKESSPHHALLLSNTFQREKANWCDKYQTVAQEKQPHISQEKQPHIASFLIKTKRIKIRSDEFQIFTPKLGLRFRLKY